MIRSNYEFIGESRYIRRIALGPNKYINDAEHNWNCIRTQHRHKRCRALTTDKHDQCPLERVETVNTKLVFEWEHNYQINSQCTPDRNPNFVWKQLFGFQIRFWDFLSNSWRILNACWIMCVSPISTVRYEYCIPQTSDAWATLTPEGAITVFYWSFILRLRFLQNVYIGFEFSQIAYTIALL